MKILEFLSHIFLSSANALDVDRYVILLCRKLFIYLFDVFTEQAMT